MPLDREKAREALLDIGVFDDGWNVGQPTVTEVLDAIEGCVTPRLAEVDVRLISEAEARLACIRAVCYQYHAEAANRHVLDHVAANGTTVEEAFRARLNELQNPPEVDPEPLYDASVLV